VRDSLALAATQETARLGCTGRVIPLLHGPSIACVVSGERFQWREDSVCLSFLYRRKRLILSR
jgi:hypothetical protein